MATTAAAKQRSTWVCPQAWRNFYLNFDGDVFVCCLNDTKIGSLKEQPFDEIWHGSRLKHLRSLHLGGDYVNSSCQQSCHELIKHYPENVTNIGDGFPGYNPDARTGDARLDSLPESPYGEPAGMEDNARLLDRELVERYCGTRSYPTRGLIVPVRRCNLRCPMCDTGVLGNKTPNTQVSEALLQGLIPVYPYLEYLEIVGGGEIFFESPNKSPITRLLHDLKQHTGPGFELLLQTNGTTLTRPWVDLLLELDITTTVNVSIDTVDPTVYDVVREGSSFAKLKQNLDYLEAEKARRGLSRPSFRFSVVLSDYTAFGLLELQEFVRRYATSMIYLQVLQKGGHESFVDEHNLFRPDRRDDLLRFREILDRIDLPSNKDSIHQIIDTCLGEVRKQPGSDESFSIDAAFAEQGFCCTTTIPEDMARHLLLEDGEPIGPGGSLHADIRKLGGGRFSVWGTALYFSASDNSDPSTNGRSYQLVPQSLGAALLS